jgi:energy-coupling factor transport system ATP-binding protein
MNRMSSLLVTKSLRVDAGGAPAIDGLSLESTGRHVIVLGAPRALFEATANLRPVEHGELQVNGALPRSAARAGGAAAASLDPRLPPEWSVFQYIWWSARLSGLSRSQSQGAVDGALDRMQLLGHASTRLRAAPVTVRRGAVISAAIVTGAPLILLEDPLVGLPGDVARSFAHVISAAVEGHMTLIFAGRLALDSPLVLASDEAIILDGSRVAAQGLPAQIAAGANSFAVRAAGDVGAFMSALGARGGLLHASERSGDSARFTVDLGDLGTRDLLRVAEASSAVVLELRPLAWVFA